VLSTPPAFVLSQDQTLQLKYTTGSFDLDLIQRNYLEPVHVTIQFSKIGLSLLRKSAPGLPSFARGESHNLLCAELTVKAYFALSIPPAALFFLAPARTGANYSIARADVNRKT
jgi:hypothetical protein